MLARICGKCSKVLNKENSKRLQYLQPNCDLCTTQDELDFEKSLINKWKNPELLENK